MKRFKGKNKIVSRKITHEVSTRADIDAAAVQASAAHFVNDIKSFIAEHKFTPEQVLIQISPDLIKSSIQAELLPLRAATQSLVP